MTTIGRVGTFLWACASVAALTADPLPVKVTCSNQQPMSDLEIAVFDNMGRSVNATSPTDLQGRFTILDTEDFLLPFSVRFLLSSGPCGPYEIKILNSPDEPLEGVVRLNANPTILRCSCSHFTSQKPEGLEHPGTEEQ